MSLTTEIKLIVNNDLSGLVEYVKSSEIPLSNILENHMNRIIEHSRLNLLYDLLRELDAFNQVPSYIVALSLMPLDDAETVVDEISLASEDWVYYQAVFKNDVAAVEKLIASPLFKQVKHKLFTVAAGLGHIEMLAFLLDYDKEITTQFTPMPQEPLDDFYVLPLHLAVIFNRQCSLEFLHKFGADLNQCDHIGCSALHIAVRNLRSELVSWLLDAGVKVNTRDTYDQTAFDIAIDRGGDDLTILTDLLAYGANIEHKNEHTKATALIVSVKNEEIQTVELLLRHHANTQVYDEDGWMPLHCAAEKGSIAILKCLLNNGATVFDETEDGISALVAAAEENKTETVVCLLDQGADISPLVKDGQLKFIYRAAFEATLSTTITLDNLIKKSNFTAALELLRKQSKSPTDYPLHLRSTDGRKNTFLHRVVMHYDGSEAANACLTGLLDHRVDPNRQNIDGKSALDLAPPVYQNKLKKLFFPDEHKFNRIADTTLIENVLLNYYLPSEACKVATYRGSETYHIHPTKIHKILFDELNGLLANAHSLALRVRHNNEKLQCLQYTCATYVENSAASDDDAEWIEPYTLTPLETRNLYNLIRNLQRLESFVARRECSLMSSGSMKRPLTEDDSKTIKISNDLLTTLREDIIVEGRPMTPSDDRKGNSLTQNSLFESETKRLKPEGKEKLSRSRGL